MEAVRKRYEARLTGGVVEQEAASGEESVVSSTWGRLVPQGIVPGPLEDAAGPGRSLVARSVAGEAVSAGNTLARPEDPQLRSESAAAFTLLAQFQEIMPPSQSFGQCFIGKDIAHRRILDLRRDTAVNAHLTELDSMIACHKRLLGPVRASHEEKSESLQGGADVEGNAGDAAGVERVPQKGRG